MKMKYSKISDHYKSEHYKRYLAIQELISGTIVGELDEVADIMDKLYGEEESLSERDNYILDSIPTLIMEIKEDAVLKELKAVEDEILNKQKILKDSYREKYAVLDTERDSIYEKIEERERLIALTRGLI